MNPYAITRWLYLRLLGVVYVAAFASLWPQIVGLVGSDGLLPVGSYLSQVRAAFGATAYVQFPTLGWLSTSDRLLEAQCAIGVALGLLLILGIAQRIVLALAWALYLSLMVCGQAFLNFQWDALLLEAGLLSLMVAPDGIAPRRPTAEPRPWAPGIWLLRVLLFKLMFLSGATKLLSLDETWWGLTALDYHYFTQPLPAWTSWYAHHLPSWFQKISVVLMFVVELGASLLVFGPRVARIVAFVSLVGLQLLIAGTGNYGFFNLLTIVLCVLVLDDAVLVPPRARGGSSVDPGRPATLERHWLRRIAPGVFVIGLLVVEGLSFGHELWRTAADHRAKLGWVGRSLEWGEQEVLRPLAPLRSFNGYGLFRAMTRERPELILEASADGVSWSPIEFRYKVGDVTRAPAFVQPHMPRLDWQMWFAALHPSGYAGLLDRLEHKILEGSPSVLGLIGMPGPPPRYVRLVLYRYQFTTPDERKRTGAWWTRERVGVGRAVAL
jgi:hypothetical protein